MAPATAFAQPAGNGLPATDFVTMDRMDGTSKAGADLSYLFPNSDANDSFYAFRFDIHGQFVAPTGVGGYVQLPITYINDTSAAGDSSTGIGDIELGVLYATKTTATGWAGVFHAGLTLPTGSTGLEGSLTNVIGGFMRFTDIYQSIPQGTSVRLAAAPIYRSGQLFLRADIGLDINLDADTNTADSFARFNVGAGVDFGGGSLMGELVNVYDLRSRGTFGDSWINAGAVSARFNTGGARPYAALTFPLDHDSHQFVNAVVTGGIEFPLR